MVYRPGGHLQAHLQGCDDAAYCPPYTLASWDCQERTEALHQEGKLGSVWSGHKRVSRSRSSSRSSSRHCSRMLTLRDWSRHSAAHHPTCCQGATVGNTYSWMPIPCPSSPQPSISGLHLVHPRSRGDGQGLH